MTSFQLLGYQYLITNIQYFFLCLVLIGFTGFQAQHYKCDNSYATINHSGWYYLSPSNQHSSDPDFICKLLSFLNTMVVQCLEQWNPGTCAVVNKSPSQFNNWNSFWTTFWTTETLTLRCKYSQQLRIFTNATFTCWSGVGRKKGNISPN